MKRLITRGALFAATIGLMLVNLIPAVPAAVLAYTMPVGAVVAYVLGGSGLALILTGFIVRKRALKLPFGEVADTLMRVVSKAQNLPTNRHYAYVIGATVYVILLSAAGFLLPMVAFTTGVVLVYLDQGLAQRDAHKVARLRIESGRVKFGIQPGHPAYAAGKAAARTGH